MPNRREFLQTGAAVSAIAANGVISGAEGAARDARSSGLRRAIYDDRYVEGRWFAAVIGEHGVPTRALDGGDITRFWYDELDPLLKREARAVAGFTQFGPMFVVEQLALERGMQLALRVEHRTSADGTLRHSFSGPRETLALAADREPPNRVAATSQGDGTPRAAMNMVGTVVTSSSSMMRGLVSRK